MNQAIVEGATVAKIKLRSSEDVRAYDLAIAAIQAAEHISPYVAHQMLITIVGETDGWDEPYQADAVWESLTGIAASERLTMVSDRGGTLVFAKAHP